MDKNRWFISFSKEKGLVTEKEKQNIKKYISEFKNSIDYANLLKSIPDIELVEIKKKMTDFNKILEKAKEIEKNEGKPKISKN